VSGGAGGDGLMRLWNALIVSLALACSGCSNSNNYESQSEAFVAHVDGHKMGRDTDYWVEMLNMSGEWEKTILVFGYTDDFAECQTVAAGLKKVNFAREYRCKPANQK
jgi:hypothetical protein